MSTRLPKSQNQAKGDAATLQRGSSSSLKVLGILFAINYDVTVNSEPERVDALARLNALAGLALADPLSPPSWRSSRRSWPSLLTWPGKTLRARGTLLGLGITDIRAPWLQRNETCVGGGPLTTRTTPEWGGGYPLSFVNKLLFPLLSPQPPVCHGPRWHRLQLSVGPGFLSGLRLRPASARDSGYSHLYPLWFLHQCER